MFKKWIDLDIQAFWAARQNAAENLANERALRGERFRRSALEDIIAGLVKTLKPGRGKSGPDLAERGWSKQTA